MAQPSNSPEFFPVPDSLVKTTYNWLGPMVTEESGLVVRPVYRSEINPLSLTDQQRDKLEPVARIIITSPKDKSEYPDAPAYMIHFPNPGSRQERLSLRQIIDDLNPLEEEITPNSAVGSLPESLNS